VISPLLVDDRAHRIVSLILAALLAAIMAFVRI